MLFPRNTDLHPEVMLSNNASSSVFNSKAFFLHLCKVVSRFRMISKGELLRCSDKRFKISSGTPMQLSKNGQASCTNWVDDLYIPKMYFCFCCCSDSSPFVVEERNIFAPIGILWKTLSSCLLSLRAGSDCDTTLRVSKKSGINVGNFEILGCDPTEALTLCKAEIGILKICKPKRNAFISRSVPKRWQSWTGYAASFEVAKDHESQSRINPHDSWGWSPWHVASKPVSSTTLVKNAVSFFRVLPSQHAWKKTQKPNCCNCMNISISHMYEFPGFLTLHPMDFECSHKQNKAMLTYMALALCTLSLLTPCSHGKPNGYCSDLSCGGPWWSSPIGISLAFEAVPQGGAPWKWNIRRDIAIFARKSHECLFLKSRFMICKCEEFRCLPKSIGKTSNPTSFNTDDNVAVPAHASITNNDVSSNCRPILYVEDCDCSTPKLNSEFVAASCCTTVDAFPCCMVCSTAFPSFKWKLFSFFEDELDWCPASDIWLLKVPLSSTGGSCDTSCIVPSLWFPVSMASQIRLSCKFPSEELT